jgi:DNA-binding NarL/FixJ family response regulator
MRQQSGLVPGARRIRVLLADPYPLILLGLQKMIEVEARFHVVGHASSLRSCLNKMIVERPEVALVDSSMAFEDIESIIRLLRSRHRKLSLVLLTTLEVSPVQRAKLALIHCEFVDKRCTAFELRTAAWKAYKELASSDSGPLLGRLNTVPIASGERMAPARASVNLGK